MGECRKWKRIKILILNCFRNRKRNNLKHVVNLSGNIPNYSNISDIERRKILIGSTASGKARKYYEEKEKFDTWEINNYLTFKKLNTPRRKDKNES